MTFKEEGAKTRVTLRSTFETTELRNYTVETFGAIEGGNQTPARLDDYVSKMKMIKSSRSDSWVPAGLGAREQQAALARVARQ